MRISSAASARTSAAQNGSITAMAIAKEVVFPGFSGASAYRREADDSRHPGNVCAGPLDTLSGRFGQSNGHDGGIRKPGIQTVR